MSSAQPKLNLEQLWAQAQDLPQDQRANLATRILDSITAPASDDDYWEKEAADRLAAYDRGEMLAVPGETVLARAREVVAQMDRDAQSVQK